jgi:hypothetical protein
LKNEFFRFQLEFVNFEPQRVNFLPRNNPARASDDNDLADFLTQTFELHVRVTISQIEIVDAERADV